ncbi:hypothetical protein Ahy_A09g042389 [Arachis hypogaea]|uniref:Reverse transcriptase zinc-binding domain-containing protein n=1 Tax=Arachis hypogaea TaxID=3818 RepID=A0A445BFR0_ARAHY|nr:hypothetical protein Ahy_A09g042389 [Arachis hypogaea]
MKKTNNLLANLAFPILFLEEENRPCDHDSDRIWKLIWNWKGVQRAKVFLWQLAHNAVLTASRTAIWGRGNNPNCMSCDNDIETPFHVIRDCPMSSPVWNCLVKSQNIEKGEGVFNLGDETGSRGSGSRIP